jgi:hypothetical protein
MAAWPMRLLTCTERMLIFPLRSPARGGGGSEPVGEAGRSAAAAAGSSDPGGTACWRPYPRVGDHPAEVAEPINQLKGKRVHSANL